MIFDIIGLLVIIAAAVWVRTRYRSKYDLRSLRDETEREDPEYDTVEDDSGPYCHRCDTANPPGANFCRSCGQRIA